MAKAFVVRSSFSRMGQDFEIGDMITDSVLVDAMESEAEQLRHLTRVNLPDDPAPKAVPKPA